MTIIRTKKVFKTEAERLKYVKEWQKAMKERLREKRNRIDPKKHRTHKINIRVNDDELEAIRGYLTKYNAKTISTVLRTIIMDYIEADNVQV